MALDDGDGGGGDRVARFAYMQVPDFWDMVRYHDNTPHQKALKGWRQTYELVLIHRTQVEKYKEKLMTAWPPKSSAAARAYVERLDHLIENLTETYEAAIANYSAYSTAISAMDDAKRKVEAIYQEHTNNTIALAEHEEALRDRPRAYGKGMAPPPPPPSPIAAGRQEELRAEAAKLMTGVSAELATAQMSFVTPKPYTPLRAVTDNSEAIGSGNISPVLPSLSTFPGRTTATTQAPRPSNSGTGSKNISTEISRERAARPGLQPLPRQTPIQGPILGGTKQAPTPSPITGIPSTSPLPLTPNAGSTDPLHLTSPHSTQPPTTLPRNPTTSNTPMGSIPSSTGTRGNPSLHGGIIGGNSPINGAPSGRSGQTGTSARSAQRINPIGGLIGQDAVARPGQRSTSRSDDETRSQHWDPDNPWETESGIAPVLLPPAEQRINPGPTIGGR